RFSLLSIIKLGIVLAIFVTAANWVSRQLEGMTSKSTQMSSGMRVGLVKFTKVVLYTVAILISLDSVGIDLTTLAVFGGALGVGLGFGLQRIASNFISGFILLFDRSIKPGDVISIGTRFGWVQELHARYIVVRDRDGVETLIPNENLITSEVINWSYSDRLVRMKIPVQVSYNCDPEEAMQLMVDAGKENTRVLKEPEPQARIIEFGDNGVGLELRVWFTNPEEGMGNLKSDLYLSIWNKFKAASITIPYPQRDVHIMSQPGGAQ
ncbi:MAG: mechanosensitive ion channel, partial [Acidiferrobacterales bacterium]|nr:mechanosensitive ion channel [Acidiferrobacterales bacterium]